MSYKTKTSETLDVYEKELAEWRSRNERLVAKFKEEHPDAKNVWYDTTYENVMSIRPKAEDYTLPGGYFDEGSYGVALRTWEKKLEGARKIANKHDSITI